MKCTHTACSNEATRTLSYGQFRTPIGLTSKGVRAMAEKNAAPLCQQCFEAATDRSLANEAHLMPRPATPRCNGAARVGDRQCPSCIEQAQAKPKPELEHLRVSVPERPRQRVTTIVAPDLDRQERRARHRRARADTPRRGARCGDTVHAAGTRT